MCMFVIVPLFLGCELIFLFASGPNWIHTSGNNPLLPIASDSNTPLHTWNGKMLVFGTDGIPISDEKATELSELRWRIITESIETSRQNGSQIPESESLYDFFVKKASELSLSNEDRNILLEMSKMWGCYVGEAVDRQSLKYMWLEEVCIGGMWRWCRSLFWFSARLTVLVR